MQYGCPRAVAAPLVEISGQGSDRLNATARFISRSVVYTFGMHFPVIPDYMLYVQNRFTNGIGRGMKHFGLSRFLLCEMPSQRAWKPTLEKLLQGVKADSWMIERYEVAVEDRDKLVMRCMTLHETTEYPIWRLASDSALDLRDMARNGAERIYILNKVSHIQLAKKNETVEKRRLREMWEVVNEYGDLGTGQCKFIVYGNYQFQLNYCMGLSGGAFYPKIYINGYEASIYRMGGKQEIYRPGKWQQYAEDYDIPPHLVTQEVVNIRAMQKMQEYLEDFYEKLPRVRLDNSILKQSLELLNGSPGDYLVSTLNPEHKPTRPHANIWGTVGDKRLCDHCSIAFSCRLYERGAVCALPGSTERSLSALFGSRNADDVIKGMGRVLQFQADRFERAAEDEYKEREAAKAAGAPPPKLDPEINKMANDLQRNAKQYAVLLNPALLKPQVQIGIVNGKVIEKPAPSEISGPEMARAVRELEAAGHTRAEITPSMVYEYIANGGQKAIEGEVIDGVKRDF